MVLVVEGRSEFAQRLEVAKKKRPKVEKAKAKVAKRSRSNRLKKATIRLLPKLLL
jgi:hypothetical protein